MTTNEIQKNLEDKLSNYYGVTPQDASIEQMYKAVSLTVMDILMDKKKTFKKEVKKEVTSMQKFALEYIANVNSLLELSKTQSEGFTLTNTNYEPLQMISETSSLLEAKNKNIKVTINQNGNIPAVLHGDPAKIKQALLHLYNGVLNISKQKKIELNTSYLIVGSLCRFKVTTDINTKDLVTEYTKDIKDKAIDFEIIERIVKLLEGKFTISQEKDVVKIELSIDQKYIEGYYIKEDVKSTANKIILKIPRKNPSVK